MPSSPLTLSTAGLDLFEGLRKWGAVRLRLSPAGDTCYLELKPVDRDWKPILRLTIFEGKIFLQPYMEGGEYAHIDRVT